MTHVEKSEEVEKRRVVTAGVASLEIRPTVSEPKSDPFAGFAAIAEAIHLLSPPSMSEPLSTSPPSSPQDETIITTAKELDAVLARLNVTTITTTQLVGAIKEEKVKRRDESYRESMCPFARIRTFLIH
jgi:hypothetical protein